MLSTSPQEPAGPMSPENSSHNVVDSPLQCIMPRSFPKQRQRPCHRIVLLSTRFEFARCLASCVRKRDNELQLGKSPLIIGPTIFVAFLFLKASRPWVVLSIWTHAPDRAPHYPTLPQTFWTLWYRSSSNEHPGRRGWRWG